MNCFINANDYGFSPEKSGKENAAILQSLLDKGGSIGVPVSGEYPIAGTLYIGSNTSLEFGAGVVLKKSDEGEPFCQLILNKGALTKEYDEHITIKGLSVRVNGMDNRRSPVFGLIGQISFFYVKDLRISGFRCYDILPAQFAVHICTFEDVIIEDCMIEGKKDGIHFGRGRRFTVRDCAFRTYDDAIALNGHDYDCSNPELGFIENGLIENCHDLTDKETVGYFCRILAGSWKDWEKGMPVQKSDSVVSGGRVYRVKAAPDEKIYISETRPTHEKGECVLDGICWVAVQDTPEYTAGVRNVTFRDIYIEKARTVFSIHFDIGKYSRSYYPGSVIPVQKNLNFENVHILHDKETPVLSVNTPVDVVNFRNCDLGNSRIVIDDGIIPDDADIMTEINICDCRLKEDAFVTKKMKRKLVLNKN